MGDFLIRRSELMQAGGQINHLIYSLENFAVSRGDTVNTGVQILNPKGMAFTILFDATLALNSDSTTIASCQKMLAIYDNSKYIFGIGRNNAADTLQRVCWETNGSWSNLTGTKKTAGRQRLAITKEKNSGIINISYKYNDTDLLTFTAIYNGNKSSTATLHFGYGTGVSTLSAGTINSAKVYNTVIDQVEIDAFMI